MARLLENIPLDAKLELCIEAFTSITQKAVINQRRQEELLDRLEAIAEGLGIIIQGLEAKSWEKAINERLKEREKDGSAR